MLHKRLFLFENGFVLGGADLWHAQVLCYNDDLFTVYKWPDEKNNDWTTQERKLK